MTNPVAKRRERERERATVTVNDNSCSQETRENRDKAIRT
jgi:hypothetical protein